jgi:hypothetical protein
LDIGNVPTKNIVKENISSSYLVVELMQNIKMITKLSDYLSVATTMPATKAVTRKTPTPVYTTV